ncbi:hypothetical protein pb186bvf_020256 [Paramecium bursaria]
MEDLNMEQQYAQYWRSLFYLTFTTQSLNCISLILTGIEFMHIKPIINIYRKKHDEERKKMIQEISNCRQETAYYQREIHELKKAKVLLSKRCELLQELIVKERLGQSVHKEIYKNNQMPISETVSSLADEKFESYETQLNSSLSNDDEMSPRQFMQLIKSRYNHNNFMKA